MEQLKVVTQQDNERMFRMISDLISKDKEFQIMITVPPADNMSRIRSGKRRDYRKNTTWRRMLQT